MPTLATRSLSKVFIYEPQSVQDCPPHKPSNQVVQDPAIGSVFPFNHASGGSLQVEIYLKYKFAPLPNPGDTQTFTFVVTLQNATGAPVCSKHITSTGTQ